MAKESHSKQSGTKEEDTTDSVCNETCGIIMPISGSDGYSFDHWVDVRNILEEVIRDIKYTPNLVSDADEIGIIHNRIVTNIYNNPIVICDVSSKNPNVMFELGLRLAFDKATIIIKDDNTNYNFDTSPIEHLTYPKDLRYAVINNFKGKLKSKLESTIAASKKDPNYSTFLKNFIQYKPTLETQKISTNLYMFKQFDEINRQLTTIRSQMSSGSVTTVSTPRITGSVSEPLSKLSVQISTNRSNYRKYTNAAVSLGLATVNLHGDDDAVLVMVNCNSSNQAKAIREEFDKISDHNEMDSFKVIVN